MQPRNEGSDLAPLRRPSRANRGLVRAGALTLVGALTLTGATVSIASASTTQKTSGPTLKSLETQLTSLEKPPSTSAALQETGSSLFYPLVSAWASAYSKAHGNVPVTTASTGSGTGQADALNGTVAIGASDAYLPPSDPSNLLNIPEDVSAQQIDYNVSGVSASHVHLKLSAAILNSIYTGKITHWNDPALKKLNPTVSLPNEQIVVLHRSDSSGDSFLFTSYLSYQDSSSFPMSAGGPTTSPSWPSIPNTLAEKGNQGMEAGCVATPGCIAYIGVSYLREAVKNGLAYAQLLNGKGNYVLPTAINIANEVASFQKIPANGAISLVDSKSAKNGYPIVNFEYAIVNANQSNPATAQAIKAFLAWGMDPRNGSASSYLSPVYFQALAPNAMAVAVNLLKKIQ
ncbi:MAG: phosphate-binding protein [Acidimicrobiaceae bacterium]|jgi:phosphate transport system substrate-binding protein|nr:phosphate-binding protein [Acidimicrobiaceae bacterium]